MSGFAKASGLIVALVYSCLLHAIVALFPYIFSTAHNDAHTTWTRKDYVVSLTATPTMAKKAKRSIAVLPAKTDRDTPGITKSTKVVDKESLSEQTSDEKEERSSPADARYYNSSELTLSPQPLSEIELDASEPNDDPGFGTLVMSLWINELGEITRATLESEGIPEAYAKAVIVAFEKTRFSPGELHGKKVASVIRIEVLPSDSASPTTP